MTYSEIATEILTRVREVTPADGVTIILREGALCHYVAEDAISPLWRGNRFPVVSCISGWAMIHKEAVFIPNIFVDVRIPHDLYRPTFVKSLLILPIRANESMQAIGIYWATIQTLSPEILDRLQSISDGVAATIFSAQYA